MNNNSSGGKAIRGLDVLILGFAFFATYFGAGNLIFPPQLGLNSGSDFLSGLAGLTLSGIFLPIFTLIVIGLNRSSRWSSPISSSASSLLPTRTTSWTAWANT